MQYTKDELAVIFVDSFDFLDYKHKNIVIDAYVDTGSLKDAIVNGENGYLCEKGRICHCARLL